MEQINKFLKKLDPRRRLVITNVVRKLKERDFYNLDIKKLKGAENLFRIRKGDVRLIYTIDKHNEIQILKIEFRNDNTY